MIAHSKRHSITEAGLDLVHRTGFAAAGVAAIAAAGGAPKGSFYNHFASKDAFGIAILDRYFEDVNATLETILGARDEPPVSRLSRYFAYLREIGERDGYARGCLIGNLSAEAAPANDAMRRHLQGQLSEWTTRLAVAVAEAQETAEVRRDVTAETLASLLLDAWQGALLRAKVERAPRALDNFIDVLLPTLLGVDQR